MTEGKNIIHSYKTSPFRLFWASLLTGVVLTSLPGTANSGGFTPCQAPFVFKGAAANIVPLEYLATAADRTMKDSQQHKRLQQTAQHLAWLMKLDSWQQPTYGSLGVVAHMFFHEKCDPDEVLNELVRYKVKKGQVLVMLQGRIFIEGDQIFLQSRLRGIHRNDQRSSPNESLGHYSEKKGLETHLGEREHRISASLPSLDITFSPRALTFAELDRIDQSFEKASIMYPEPAKTPDGIPLHFEGEQPQAFRILSHVDEKWLKIEDFFSGNSGFIQTDSSTSARLHASLPELDFLNGLLGYLRISQDQTVPNYSLPIRSAIRQADESFARFSTNQKSTEDFEARALASALRGIFVVKSKGAWREARKHFVKAVTILPYRSVYHNLLGLADAMLCCSGPPEPGFEDPTQSFVKSLSLSPNNSEALFNLDSFLAYLDETEKLPAGINIKRLKKRRDVIRKVISRLDR